MGAKVHAFEPSGRRVVTVVGRGGEHWVDPGARACSCASFHYRGAPCAHVEAALAGGAETIAFSDDEYDDFVRGLIDDIWLAHAAGGGSGRPARAAIP